MIVSKIVFKPLAWLLLTTMGLLLIVTSSVAATTDAILQQMDADVALIEEYTAIIDYADSLEGYQEIQTKSFEVINKMADSANEYQKFSEDPEHTESTAALQQIKGGITAIASSAQLITSAIENQDDIAFEDALTNYNSAIDQYNSGVDAYNASIGASTTDYGPILLTILIVTALLSGILLLRSLVGDKSTKDERIKMTQQRQLFYNSLVPLGAIVVSYIWYVRTPPGGTFVMLWGLLAVGYISFITSAFKYYNQSKVKTNKTTPSKSKA